MIFGAVLCVLFVAGSFDKLHAQNEGGGSQLVPVSLRGETLLPAAMGVRTDKSGSAWNVEANGTIGRVGSTMVNSGLALLVNGQKFVSFQPLMTEDGREFVMQGRSVTGLPGLQIIRRIRQLDESGGLRYLEIFYNGSANPMTLNVSLATNFSGNYRTFLTDRGNSESVIMQENEGGILVLPGPSQSNRAFLFSLTSADSPKKPTISVQNRYGLTFQYQITVAPGESKAIAHAVAQVVIPQSFDRRNLLKVFRPYSLNEVVDTIPGVFQDVLVNGPKSALSDGKSLSSVSSLDSLGVKRGSRDILAMGEKTRIVGTASCEELSLTTRYGEALIPFEKIAAISGGKQGNRDAVQIFLKDGQVFSGKGVAKNLKFALANGGKMNLNLETLDRLLMAKSEAESTWTSEAAAILETYEGERLVVQKDEDLELSGVTPWGSLRFSADELVWLGPVEGEPVGHFVELKNGAGNIVYFAGNDIDVQSSVFGAVSLDLSRVRSIITPSGGKAGQAIATLPNETRIRARGSQEIVGVLTDSTLKIVSEGQAINMKPGDIRRMNQIEGTSASAGGLPLGTPLFRIETWDGSIATGYLQLDFFSIRVGREIWQIPLSDIVELESPTPTLAPDAQEGITRLITQLGADDWITREKATRELGAFGYLARPVLERERNQNTDPEVTRRIDRVLTELK